MRFLTTHTEIYSQMASGRPLISNPACWSYECFCDIESNSHLGLMNVFVILNQTAMLIL
jgi:hypothetical protein